MFYGREMQMKALMALFNKRTASLVTCRGRRRIGKSTLIEVFADKSRGRFIKIEGVKPRKGFSDETQLKSFAEQLAAQTGADPTPASNWLNSFIRLNDKISDDERTVVLLDEVSWLGHFDEDFAETIKIAWDNYWKKHPRLIVVLCGSVSSWIKDNIIDNGAFVGRRSLDVVVDELPLGECVKFWGRQAERLAPREIIDVLSVTGGVPRYLEEIDPALDANANIAKLCFSPHGILRDDFDDMFNDVITKLPAMCGRVLRSLVDGAKTVSDISEALGIARGGSVSETLDILSEAGLVRRDAGRNPETADLVRQPRYRLKDNYSRFYLKYIEPVKDMIDDGSYDFTSMSSMPGWDAVLGLAFENLVVNNYRELLPRLHLGGTLITSAAPYVRRKTKEREGCQVDLLIQSRRSLYFVEIKRKAEIGREVIEQVDSSVRSISRPEGVSAHTALVYDGNLSPVVEADGYFDAIVSFREVLGL